MRLYFALKPLGNHTEHPKLLSNHIAMGWGTLFHTLWNPPK